MGNGCSPKEEDLSCLEFKGKKNKEEIKKENKMKIDAELYSTRFSDEKNLLVDLIMKKDIGIRINTHSADHEVSFIISIEEAEKFMAQLQKQINYYKDIVK